ncbi:MAG: ribosomal protein S18-alanine N-acetyltransferase [Micromonosporaceae bacterium]
MSIRRLRWWDIEDLIPLERDLFGAEEWSATMFWNELANGHYYIVDRDETGVVGYAGMAVAEEAWVNNIAVRRDRQRQGVGRALLTDLLGYAADHQVRRILLEVAADNAPAQRLYARYGFDVVGVRHGYYQISKKDALVMSLDLAE